MEDIARREIIIVGRGKTAWEYTDIKSAHPNALIMAINRYIPLADYVYYYDEFISDEIKRQANGKAIIISTSDKKDNFADVKVNLDTISKIMNTRFSGSISLIIASEILFYDTIYTVGFDYELIYGKYHDNPYPHEENRSVLNDTEKAKELLLRQKKEYEKVKKMIKAMVM